MRFYRALKAWWQARSIVTKLEAWRRIERLNLE